MPRLSASTIVIFSAICFTGLIVMQAAWIQSAYEGELAMYNKEKKQFESELLQQLKNSNALKSGVKNILEHYNRNQLVSPADEKWFFEYLPETIAGFANESQYGFDIPHYNIIHHKHQQAPASPGMPTLLFKTDAKWINQYDNAGKLCLHCILDIPADSHADFNYHLVLFYRGEKHAIYKKMGLLIAGSFLFLFLFGILFRQMLKKYRVEKKLSVAKNDFINNLSHELQTPVFAVQIANKLIKEKTVDLPDVKPFIEIIEKETKQLKQHAGKILELASLENGQVELYEQVTEINSFIGEKRPTLQMMLQNKMGELSIRQNGFPLYAKIDRVHFNNVLVSVTDNAIKYNDAVPRLFIETGEEDEMIRVAISDNGTGIDQQNLPYIFDKFYRVPGAQRNGATGFGLGLSYVKQIIQLHKGQIRINSEAGKGTTLVFLLPKAEPYV